MNSLLRKIIDENGNEVEIEETINEFGEKVQKKMAKYQNKNGE